MSTIEELAATQQSMANQLASMARELQAMQSAQQQQMLYARLAEGTMARFGDYPGGASVVAAGSSEPGETNVLAPGSVTGDTIADEAITATKIAPAAINDPVLFADSIQPIGVVTSLPTLPDTKYPAGGGQLVFLTTVQRLYKTVDGTTWVVATDGTDLTADSIKAGTINAGAITGRELNTAILLASLIKTADEGRRVQISPVGIELVDDDETLLVRIPTDPDLSVYVRGDVEAGSLEVAGEAALNGALVMRPGVVGTLSDRVKKPSAAPTLTQVPYYTFTPSPQPATGDNWGLTSTGTNHWMVDVESSTYRLREYGVNFDTNPRNKDTGVDSNNYLSNGIAVSGSYLYFMASKIDNTSLTIYKYALSDLSLVTSKVITADVARPTAAGIMFDSTASRVVVITATGTGSGKQLRFRKYDESLTLQTTTDATGLSVTDPVFPGGAFDGTYYWVVVLATNLTPASSVRKFSTAGVYQSDAEFGWLSSGSVMVGQGLAHDGSNFYGRNIGAGGAVVFKFSSWDWTTESAKYWCGYSWYDSDSTGGTHETEVGPRASITLTRRTALRVQNAAIPDAGGTDDPNNVRVYLGRGTTDPDASAYGNLDLQATDALLTRDLTTYNSAGAADPTSSDFPAATASELKSSVSGWSLKGDGTATMPSIIQAGATSLTTSSEAYKIGTVTFATAFAGTPIVVASVASGNQQYICQAYSISSSGFSVMVSRKDATSFSATVAVNWIAMYGQG